MTFTERRRIAYELGRCIRCGKVADDEHHRRAKCRGGTEHAWNKVLACRQCHATFGQVMGQHLSPSVLHANAQKKNALTLLLKHGLRFYWMLPSFVWRMLPRAMRKRAEAT